MTQVGKILVLAIVGFSLVFLGISTTVFMTSKNWRDETKKKDADLKKVQSSLSAAKAQVDEAKKALEEAKSQAATQTKQQSDRIRGLEDQNKRDLTDLQDAKAKYVVANENAKSALEEAAFRRNETILLRTQKSAVEKQANDFKLRQADLTDKIRELERAMETATKNNSDLREQVAKFTTLLNQNGLSTDISQIKGLESPPKVEGLIKRVDATNRRVEITIGSDDGLVPGHELSLYRLKPRPEYLGKIKIVAPVDPNQAVGLVVGKTYQGKKIKEGDIVSSTISPRF